MTTSSGTGPTDRDMATARAFWPVEAECGFHHALAGLVAKARAEGREEGRAEASAVLDRLGEDYLAKHGGGGDYCRALADVRAHLPTPGGGDRSGG